MDLDTQEQPLMRKSYLVILGVALVIMFILNPGAVRRVLPDRFGGRSGRTSRTRTATVRTPDVLIGDDDLQAEVVSIRQDVEAFRSWIIDEQQTPSPVVRVIERACPLDIARLDENPTRSGMLRYKVFALDGEALDAERLRDRLVLEVPSGVLAEIRNITNAPQDGYTVTVAVTGAGRVALGDREVPEMPPVYYDVQMRSVWPVRIVGTVGGNNEEGWTAIRGSRSYQVGDLIETSDDTRVSYRVVTISRRCVWLRVEDPAAEAPAQRRWSLPDIRRIVLSSTMQPARVEMREGVSLAAGESLTFGATGSSLTVERLWRNSAHFRYRLASGDVYDLVCVIVR